ncbi:MAG: choice-of-anchor J domain-containing protein [Bacteroidetes bacterium]|nr:choice-of-anchor J domain-containing protein [Bacteroidota bacterium]
MKKITFILSLLTLSFGVQSKVVQTPLANAHGVQAATRQAQSTLAAGDTLLHMPLLGYYVNPGDISGFSIVTEDGDGLTPAANALQNPDWAIYYSTAASDLDPNQGDVDTAYFFGVNSWFTSPGLADNWLILGPISLPPGGGELSWKVKETDPDFMDGYEVLANVNGGASGDFTLPALYSIGDNDPANDTVWITHTVTLDAATYGGQKVYIAFHHNAFDMNALFLDNILVTENASTALTNDECAGATDINAAFGGTINTVQAIGPYDNTSASTSASDPTVGFECFGEPDGTGTGPELNNTLWFTFTGDGSTYLIESGTCNGVTNYISDGDTQFGLYTGSCGNFTAVDCNEDGPSATATEYPAGLTVATTPGTVYYLMVDGFSFQGTVSIGEFCLLVKKLQAVTCNDPQITAGSVTQNTGSLCFGDTVSLSSSAPFAPNGSGVNGFSWVVTNADISGTHNPLDPATFVASYGFLTTAPTVSNLTFINDTTFLTPGTYYWTPVVFGNAVDPGSAQFLSQLTLDTSCVHTGTSLQVILLAVGDTSCNPPVLGPVNDECAGAVDINAAFGGTLNVVQAIGPYDNTLATTSALDPTLGFECFGEPDGTGTGPELNNTLWFTFTGDGSTYLIESGTCNGVTNYISDGDTQFGLYTGSCGNFTAVDCNEDGPSATATEYPAGLTVATTPELFII